MLALGLVALAPAAVAGDNFVATLSGDQEVPTRDTQARGVATSKLRQDGAALAFKVNVANIDNVFAAHIHCGAVGVNGPVGVTLFMGAPAGGRVNGTLAAGTITAPDAGNLCGWADLAAVLGLPLTRGCSPTGTTSAGCGCIRPASRAGMPPATPTATRADTRPSRGKPLPGPRLPEIPGASSGCGVARRCRT
jgi:CHRD domain